MATDGKDFTDPRSLANTALLDLLKTTTEQHPWDGKFETLQKWNLYEICNRWFAKDRITFDGGTSIIRNVQLAENGSAKFTQPYTKAEVGVVDVQARIRAEWTQATADWSISRQEMMRNRSKPKLISLVKTRRIAAMADLANLLEEKSWVSPEDSSDVLNPLGIPMWITPIVTGETADHNGENPLYSGGTTAADCGGIDSSLAANARWRNYNDRWSAAADHAGSLNAADIIKITRMLRRLKFQSPTFVKDMENGAYRDMRLYTGEENLESLEERAREQNDQLGADVGRYAGATLIKNLPVVWIQQLDKSEGVDTTYPLYALNHAYFTPFIMEGDYMRETGPMNSRDYHDVFTTFVDMQFNFICTNRQRAGGMISAVVA